ncbi:hypothetical protein LC065_18360 [Halobacillus litoralis]|uniref:hypothetical protein n=1 Tax=Halobacillus litoralis TaxID=45668 RepID=UPI0027400744|nr:hypothetical protein [Halobacillus litoralis]WLR47451.1 hypothetical protein LC065_18360 [Halobacillus litoralis]
MKTCPFQRAILLSCAFILIIFALINHLSGGDQWIGNVSLFTGFTTITYLEYFSHEAIVLGFMSSTLTVLMTWGVYESLMSLFLDEFGSYLRIGAVLFVHHWLAKGINGGLKKRRE